MIAVPAFLFYFLLVILTLFAVLVAAALLLAVGLFWNLRRLSQMALVGVEDARERLAYVSALFSVVSGI